MRRHSASASSILPDGVECGNSSVVRDLICSPELYGERRNTLTTRLIRREILRLQGRVAGIEADSAPGGDLNGPKNKFRYLVLHRQRVLAI